MKRNWVRFCDHIINNKWNPKATGERTKPTNSRVRGGSVPAGRCRQDQKSSERAKESNGGTQIECKRRARSLTPVRFKSPAKKACTRKKVTSNKETCGGDGDTMVAPRQCDAHILDHMRCTCPACMDFACRWRRALKKKFVTGECSKKSKKPRRWTYKIGGQKSNYPPLHKQKVVCLNDEPEQKTVKWPYVGSPKINWWFGKAEALDDDIFDSFWCDEDSYGGNGHMDAPFLNGSDDQDCNSDIEFEWQCDPKQLRANRGGHSLSSADNSRHKHEQGDVDDSVYVSVEDEGLPLTTGKQSTKAKGKDAFTRGDGDTLQNKPMKRDTSNKRPDKESTTLKTKNVKQQHRSKRRVKTDVIHPFDSVAMHGTMSTGALEDHFRSVTCTNPASKMLSPGGFLDCASGDVSAKEGRGSGKCRGSKTKSRLGGGDATKSEFKDSTRKIGDDNDDIKHKETILGDLRVVDRSDERDHSDNRSETSRTKIKVKKWKPRKSPTRALAEGKYISEELKRSIDGILNNDHNRSNTPTRDVDPTDKPKSQKGKGQGSRKETESGKSAPQSTTLPPQENSNESISETTKFLRKYGAEREYSVKAGKVVPGSARVVQGTSYLTKDDRGFYHFQSSGKSHDFKSDILGNRRHSPAYRRQFIKIMGWGDTSDGDGAEKREPDTEGKHLDKTCFQTTDFEPAEESTSLYKEKELKNKSVDLEKRSTETRDKVKSRVSPDNVREKSRERKRQKRASKPPARSRHDSDISANNSPAPSPPYPINGFCDDLVHGLDTRGDGDRSVKHKRKSKQRSDKHHRESKHDGADGTHDDDKTAERPREGRGKHYKKQSKSEVNVRTDSPPPSSSDIHTSQKEGGADKDVVLWSPWGQDNKARQDIHRHSKRKKTSKSKDKRRKEYCEASDDSSSSDDGVDRRCKHDKEDHRFASPWSNTINKWSQEQQSIRSRRKAAELAEWKERSRYDNLIPDGEDYISPSSKSEDGGNLLSNEAPKYKTAYLEKGKIKQHKTDKSQNKAKEKVLNDSSDSSSDCSPSPLQDETENCRSARRPFSKGKKSKQSRFNTRASGFTQSEYGRPGSSPCSICNYGNSHKYGGSSSKSRSRSRDKTRKRSPRKDGRGNRKSSSPFGYSPNTSNRKGTSVRFDNSRGRMLSKSPGHQYRMNSTYNKPVYSKSPNSYSRSPGSSASPKGYKHNTSGTQLGANKGQGKPKRVGVSYSDVCITGPIEDSDISVSTSRRPMGNSEPLETINIRGPLKPDKDRRPLVEVNIFGPLDQDEAECQTKYSKPQSTSSRTSKVSVKHTSPTHQTINIKKAPKQHCSPTLSPNAQTVANPGALWKQKSKPIVSITDCSRNEEGCYPEQSDGYCSPSCPDNYVSDCMEQYSSNCINGYNDACYASDSATYDCYKDIDESSNHPTESALGSNNSVNEEDSQNEKDKKFLEECGGFMFSEYKKDKKPTNVKTNLGGMFQTDQGDNKVNITRKINNKDSSKPRSNRDQTICSPSKQNPRGIPTARSPNKHEHKSTTLKNEQNSLKITRNKASGDEKNKSISNYGIGRNFKASQKADYGDLTAPLLRLKSLSGNPNPNRHKTVNEVKKVRPKSTTNLCTTKSGQRFRSASVPRLDLFKSKAKSSCYPYVYTDSKNQSKKTKGLDNGQTQKGVRRKTTIEQQKPFNLRPKETSANKVVTFKLKKYPETIWHKYARAERENQNWSNKIAEVAEANGFTDLPIYDVQNIHYKKDPITTFENVDLTSSTTEQTNNSSRMRVGINRRATTRTSTPAKRRARSQEKLPLSAHTTHNDTGSCDNSLQLAGWVEQSTHELSNTDGSHMAWRHGDADLDSRPVAGRRVNCTDDAIIVSSRATACMVDAPIQRLVNASDHSHGFRDCNKPDSVGNDRKMVQGKSGDYRQRRPTNDYNSYQNAKINTLVGQQEVQQSCPVEELNQINGRYCQPRSHRRSTGRQHRNRRRSGPSPPLSSSNSSIDVSTRSNSRPMSTASTSQTKPKVVFSPHIEYKSYSGTCLSTDSPRRVESPIGAPQPSLDSDFLAQCKPSDTITSLNSNVTTSLDNTLTQFDVSNGPRYQNMDGKKNHQQPTFRAAKRILGDCAPRSEPQWKDRHITLMGECSEEKMENALQRVNRIHAKAKHLEGSVTKLKMNFGDIENRLDKVRMIQSDYISKAEEAVDMVRDRENGLRLRPRDRSRNNAVCSPSHAKSVNHYTKQTRFGEETTPRSALRHDEGVEYVHRCDKCESLGKSFNCDKYPKNNRKLLMNDGECCSGNLCCHSCSLPGAPQRGIDFRSRKDKELLSRVRQSFGRNHDNKDFEEFRERTNASPRKHIRPRSKSWTKSPLITKQNCDKYSCNQTGINISRYHNADVDDETYFSDRSSNNSNDGSWSHILDRYQQWVWSPTSGHRQKPTGRISKNENRDLGMSQNICHHHTKPAARGKSVEHDPSLLERVWKWSSSQLVSPVRRFSNAFLADGVRRESGYESDFSPSEITPEKSEQYVQALRKVAKDLIKQKRSNTNKTATKRFINTSKSLSRIYAQGQSSSKPKRSVCTLIYKNKRSVSKHGKQNSVATRKHKVHFIDSKFAKQVYSKSLPCVSTPASKPRAYQTTPNRSKYVGMKPKPFKTPLRPTRHRSQSNRRVNLRKSSKHPHSRPRSCCDLPRTFTPITGISLVNQIDDEEGDIPSPTKQRDTESIYSSEGDYSRTGLITNRHMSTCNTNRSKSEAEKHTAADSASLTVPKAMHIHQLQQESPTRLCTPNLSTEPQCSCGLLTNDIATLTTPQTSNICTTCVDGSPQSLEEFIHVTESTEVNDIIRYSSPLPPPPSPVQDYCSIDINDAIGEPTHNETALTHKPVCFLSSQNVLTPGTSPSQHVNQNDPETETTDTVTQPSSMQQPSDVKPSPGCDQRQVPKRPCDRCSSSSKCGQCEDQTADVVKGDVCGSSCTRHAEVYAEPLSKRVSLLKEINQQSRGVRVSHDESGVLSGKSFIDTHNCVLQSPPHRYDSTAPLDLNSNCHRKKPKVLKDNSVLVKQKGVKEASLSDNASRNSIYETDQPLNSNRVTMRMHSSKKHQNYDCRRDLLEIYPKCRMVNNIVRSSGSNTEAFLKARKSHGLCMDDQISTKVREDGRKHRNRRLLSESCDMKSHSLESRRLQNQCTCIGRCIQTFGEPRHTHGSNMVGNKTLYVGVPDCTSKRNVLDDHIKWYASHSQTAANYPAICNKSLHKVQFANQTSDRETINRKAKPDYDKVDERVSWRITDYHTKHHHQLDSSESLLQTPRKSHPQAMVDCWENSKKVLKKLESQEKPASDHNTRLKLRRPLSADVHSSRVRSRSTYNQSYLYDLPKTVASPVKRPLSSRQPYRTRPGRRCDDSGCESTFDLDTEFRH